MSSITDLSTLKINYLTNAQYEAALTSNLLNPNELYLTPATPNIYCGSATPSDPNIDIWFDPSSNIDGEFLPAVSSADNGKTLQVNDGDWSVIQPGNYLPDVTSADNGKIARVDNGDWSLQQLSDLIYPIGSVYVSTANVSPASFLGGYWNPIEGRFLLSSSSSYTAGSTGGAATVALNDVKYLPAHTHGEKSLSGYMRFRRYGTSGTGTNIALDVSGIVSKMEETWSGTHALLNIGGVIVSNPKIDRFTIKATHTHSSVGSGTEHENMPPYSVVYMWERVTPPT